MMREWKFAGDLVVRTLHFCCREHRFSPWLGNLRPASHAVWPQIKKKKRRRWRRWDQWTQGQWCKWPAVSGRAVCGPDSGTLFFLPFYSSSLILFSWEKNLSFIELTRMIFKNLEQKEFSETIYFISPFHDCVVSLCFILEYLLFSAL